MSSVHPHRAGLQSALVETPLDGGGVRKDRARPNFPAFWLTRCCVTCNVGSSRRARAVSNTNLLQQVAQMDADKTFEGLLVEGSWKSTLVLHAARSMIHPRKAASEETMSTL